MHARMHAYTFEFFSNEYYFKFSLRVFFIYNLTSITIKIFIFLRKRIK